MDDKKLKCLTFLKKIGFLINYNDLDLYHGRSGRIGEDWYVKPDYDNSCNVEENNIMAIPCLCVATYTIAENYARGTSLNGRTGKMKVHEIVSTDEDSLIVNEKFEISKLKGNDVMKFYHAIYFLSKDVLKEYLACEEFSYFSEFKEIIRDMRFLNTNEEFEIFQTISSKFENVQKESFNKVVGAINASILFAKFPIKAVSDYVFSKKRNHFILDNEKFSINQDFVRMIMDKSNIIALKKKAFSGDDDIVYVFNLSKIQTMEKIQLN